MGNGCCRKQQERELERDEKAQLENPTSLAAIDVSAMQPQPQMQQQEPVPRDEKEEAKAGGGIGRRKPCAFLTQTCRGHTSGVNCMAVDEAGDLVATGSDDSSVRVWQLAGGELHEAAVLRGHQDYITCVLSSASVLVQYSTAVADRGLESSHQ